MLIERGLTVGLDNVRLADVAEAAGRTTGAAYHIWGSHGDDRYGGGQGRFHMELAIKAVETIGVEHDAVVKVISENPGASLAEIVRLGAKAALDDFTDPAAGWDVVLGLIAAARSAPELIEPHRRAFGELTDAYVELFTPFFAAFGKRIREPYTMYQLCVTLIAMADGFAIRVLADPDAVDTAISLPTGPDGSEQPWHLFACAVDAVLDRFTEDIEPVDPSPA